MSHYQQDFDPIAESLGWSALLAALPLVTLFVLLAGMRWRAWTASLVALGVAVAVAVFGYSMPVDQTALAASEGAAFGLFPIIWIVITAIWIYRLTERCGWDVVLRRSFGSVSDDQRIQAVIIAFCFGALLEALAGFGTPVAVSAAMLMAVGVRPIKAASVALVANTAPVAFGAIAVPITTLARLTGLEAADLGAMVGRQTPLLGLVVPLVLVVIVDGLRGLRETWPAALVAGVAFGGGQFVCANYLAYEVTDIVAAFTGALAVILLLRVWQPGRVLVAERRPPVTAGGAASSERFDAMMRRKQTGEGSAWMAFAPYLIIVGLFSLVTFGPLKEWLDARSGWQFSWPGLHVTDPVGEPLSAVVFNFNIANAAGTVLLAAGVLTALLYRVGAGQAVHALWRTAVHFRWTVLTVMTVLALAYVMNFSGQTVTLGLFLAQAGTLFALLSPVVGWLGVAITGSDTSSNSLFGLLQLTAAERTGISAELLGAANTTGGVLGKMVSPQNLAIAAAVVGMEGRESELFRRVVGWGLLLLSGICVLVYLQSTPVLGWMVVG